MNRSAQDADVPWCTIVQSQTRHHQIPSQLLAAMTRGNQRDEARLKNAKDAAGKGVKKDGSYLLRKEADSNALAEKVRVATSLKITLFDFILPSYYPFLTFL